MIWGRDIQNTLIGVHRVDKPFRQASKGFIQLSGTRNNLVVDIRNVSHIVDLIPPGSQSAYHHIEHDQHPGVTEMTIVIDGHSANIYPYPSGNERLKKLFFARQTIVDLESHAIILINGVANVNEMRRVLQLARETVSAPTRKSFEKVS